MSLSTNTTFRVYLEKLGGSNPSEFVGNDGEVFLDPSIPTLKLSDGSTPGGVDIGGSGGGGIGTDGSVNTTGIITASLFSGTTATFSGNVSVGGTLTYDDVTNVDSIGLITARTGIEVLSGIVTTPKLHVDSVGSGITFSEDLVVQGDARVTGILSIGTSSIVFDSSAKTIRGVDEIHIGTASTVILKQKITGEIEFAHSDGTEAPVGIGSTANINTTGIITASSFVGDGSGLTGIGVEDLDDFALNQTQNLDYSTWSSDNTPTAGQWHININFFYLPKVDANGTDHSSNFRALDGTTTLVITQGATTYNITNATLFSDQLDDTYERALITSGASAGGLIATIDGQITKSGAISITCSSFSGADIALADGDLLQYNSTDSKFKPAQASGVRSLLGIGEYVDDAAAGTGGLSSGELYYNTTSSSYVLKS